MGLPGGGARGFLADRRAAAAWDRGPGRRPWPGLGPRPEPGPRRGRRSSPSCPRAMRRTPSRRRCPGCWRRITRESSGSSWSMTGATTAPAAIAAELGEKAARDGGAPLTVVDGQPRPDGWAGKVWAMAQGLAADGDGSGPGAPGPVRRGRPVRAGPDRGAAAAPSMCCSLTRISPGRQPRCATWSGPRKTTTAPRLADGAAAGGDGVGAGDRARLRLLLRPALSVQEGQRPEEPDLGRGRRLHADQGRGAGAGRRPRADQRRADRRRRPRHAAQETGQSHLARPHRPTSGRRGRTRTWPASGT